MALGAHSHATWDMLAFVHNGLDPESKHALSVNALKLLLSHDPF